jgi:hypothetical protein
VVKENQVIYVNFYMLMLLIICFFFIIKDFYENLEPKSENDKQDINLNNISKTKYVKISKEDLFNGVIPSSLLVSPSAKNQIASNLGINYL